MKKVKKMVNIINNKGKVVSFSVRGFGRRFRGSVKKMIESAKEAVKNAFVFIHEKLTIAENYILAKLTKVGKRADEYLTGRTETETEAVIPTTVVSL